MRTTKSKYTSFQLNEQIHKHDTSNYRKRLVTIMFNENARPQVLNEDVTKIHEVSLKYFKLVNWNPVVGPPRFLSLRIDGIPSHTDILYNVTSFPNTTAIKPICTEVMPLHYRPDPIIDPLVPVYTLSGYQNNGLGLMASDFNSFKTFIVTLLGDDQTPLAFTNNTVGLLVFEISYEGHTHVSQEYAAKFRS